jgi:hypothetical protein
LAEGINVTNTDLRDKAFHAIIARMVETTRAPKYTELGAALGIGFQFWIKECVPPVLWRG